MGHGKQNMTANQGKPPAAGTPGTGPRRLFRSAGIRTKLIVIFVAIKVVPLLALAWFAWEQAKYLGQDVSRKADELASGMLETVAAVGGQAIDDSVLALDRRSREAIERLTTDTARAVADFLYERDHDIQYAALLPVDEDAYRRFLFTRRRAVVGRPTRTDANDVVGLDVPM